jgi:hypothetical protein
VAGHIGKAANNSLAMAHDADVIVAVSYTHLTLPTTPYV